MFNSGFVSSFRPAIRIAIRDEGRKWAQRATQLGLVISGVETRMPGHQSRCISPFVTIDVKLSTRQHVNLFLD